MQLVRSVSLGTFLLIGAVGTGCARAGQFAEAPGEAPQPIDHALSTSRERVILPPEIIAASNLTAYDAVLKLRPAFFFTHGSTGLGLGRAPVRPSVVIGGGVPEPLEALRMVSAADVAEIRFIEPTDARVRYGSAYIAGVILVGLHGTGRRQFN